MIAECIVLHRHIQKSLVPKLIRCHFLIRGVEKALLFLAELSTPLNETELLCLWKEFTILWIMQRPLWVLAQEHIQAPQIKHPRVTFAITITPAVQNGNGSDRLQSLEIRRIFAGLWLIRGSPLSQDPQTRHTAPPELLDRCGCCELLEINCAFNYDFLLKANRVLLVSGAELALGGHQRATLIWRLP